MADGARSRLDSPNVVQGRISQRLRLVNIEHMPGSSDRKRGCKALLVGRTEDEDVRVPVWLSSFKDRSCYRMELERLGVANRVEVGPRLLETVENVRVCSHLPEEFHIVETYVGVSLEAMMFNHDVAAPILYSNSSGATLAPVGSETRSLQAAKIAFDIGCELRALHGAGWFYNDLKPSNIAIQAFGDDPLEIRATLVDFESMSTLNGHLPTIRTDDCYRKLEDYSGTQEMSAQAFDMGCFTLAIASLVSSKSIAELTSGDIDAVQGICGGVFQVNNEGALESQSMTPKVLKGIAEVCHLKEADMGENLGTTRVAENRLGYLDLSDLRRINQTPEFVLESMRYQIAVAFHAIWRDASLSRNAVAVEFENQDKDLREQGLAQAKSVLSYLGTLGYGLVPIGSGSDRAAIAQLPENVIISLARKEHERWMEMHLALGYRYQERDENGMRQEKCNEHLLKWEDLKKIDSEGRPIQVEGNSVADLKMTRAKKVVVWAEGLVDVLKRVAHLAVVRVSRG